MLALSSWKQLTAEEQLFPSGVGMTPKIALKGGTSIRCSETQVKMKANIGLYQLDRRVLICQDTALRPMWSLIINLDKRQKCEMGTSAHPRASCMEDQSIKTFFLKPVSRHLPSLLYHLLGIFSLNHCLLPCSNQSPAPTFHPHHVPFAPHFPPTLLLVCLLSCERLSHKARFLFDILHVSIVHFLIFTCFHSSYFFSYL